MYFDELQLNDRVLDALYDMRFEVCTPVQEQCIPHILNGRDVLGVAQTGTGKTAAYLLPILSKLQDGGYPKDFTNCIVMSPTRELAQQIDQAMQGFAYYLDGISSVAVYGGNDGGRYDQEMKGLSLGADVIIATPGRLISHITMGNTDFSHVSFFVLDEADRMLDMGFSEDIMKIAKQLPPSCQTIMFSATMPEKIEELAKTLLHDPAEVKIAVSKPADKIKQTAYVCHEEQKLGIIKEIFKQGDLRRVIIFSGKKQKVKLINRALQRMNINSGEMHSDLEQAQRDDIMHRFKSGQIDVLVATDIVSRGIDIDDIAMVINFDVPRDAEDYVHRIGRTARADRDGMAITFVCEQDIMYFKQIEKLLGKEVEKSPVPSELGEAPAYKQRSRGGRDRGRERRNSRKGSGNERNSRGERQRKSSDEAPLAQQNGAEEAPRGAEEQTKRPDSQRGRSQRSRRSDRQRKPANAETARKKAENSAVENVADKSNSSQATNKTNKSRQQRRRQQRRRNDNPSRQRNPQSVGKPQRRPMAEPQWESKLKSLISKPLRWLGLKK